MFNKLVSTYIVCEKLSMILKQVSGWTVNFCPNSPESPFLEFQTRKAPPPPENEKLQIWDDQSLHRNTPPPHEKLQIWDVRNPPPQNEKLQIRWCPKCPKFTYSGIPLPPNEKLQIWDDQSLLWNTSSLTNEKLQIWDDQSLFRFEMTKVYSRNTPSQWKTG